MKDYEVIWNVVNAMAVFTKDTIQTWMEEASQLYGITDAKYLILRELDMYPNISLKALAKSQMVSAPSMSIMINILVEAHYVERVSNTEDRRKVVLKLTEEGRKIYHEVNVFIMKQLNAFVDQMQTDIRQDFVKASENMLAIIKKI